MADITDRVGRPVRDCAVTAIYARMAYLQGLMPYPNCIEVARMHFVERPAHLIDDRRVITVSASIVAITVTSGSVP